MRPEGMIGSGGLGVEHVDHRARQLPPVERIEQIPLDQMAATTGVDDARTLWQRVEGRSA